MCYRLGRWDTHALLEPPCLNLRTLLTVRLCQTHHTWLGVFSTPDGLCPSCAWLAELVPAILSKGNLCEVYEFPPPCSRLPWNLFVTHNTTSACLFSISYFICQEALINFLHFPKCDFVLYSRLQTLSYGSLGHRLPLQFGPII